MSRRDTIIIALLVNASLLALLFMLAINTDDEMIIEQPDISQAVVAVPERIPMQSESKPLVAKQAQDEVDNFLKDLATEDTDHVLVIDEERYTELQREVPVVVKQAVTQPPVPTAKQRPDETHYVEVTVKKGDALEKIARNNDTTVEAIKKANQLTSAKLSIGQVLRVPISNQAKEGVAAAPKPQLAKPVASTISPKTSEKSVGATDDTIQYYTIKRGDNPWKVAKQFDVRFEDLLKMNHLDEEKARNLRVGDKIRVK